MSDTKASTNENKETNESSVANGTNGDTTKTAPSEAPAEVAIKADADTTEQELVDDFEKKTKLPAEDAKDEDDALLINKTTGLHDRATLLDVEQSDPNSPLYSVKTFEEIGELAAKPELIKAVYSMGWNKPSRIQEHALPIVLTGKKNLIAQAQSGTGKTAAFTLSQLVVADESLAQPQTLCVCPTRELARQNDDVMRALTKFTKLQTCLAVKDASITSKISAQCVIGTPGKLIELIKKGKLATKAIRMFVLDEADVMIDTQGQLDATTKIQKSLPKNVQTLLFSATYEERVAAFAEKFVPPPLATIRLQVEELSLDKIAQFKINCESDANRIMVLEDIYGFLSVGASIIFVQRKSTARQLMKKMCDDGHTVTMLTGDMSPEERDACMDDFRAGKSKVLISTNVLSRGIDIGGINLVINYDPPLDKDNHVDYSTYLHRIGRSGRFGRSGIAINFYYDEQTKSQVQKIAEHFKKEIKEYEVDDIPKLADMLRELN